MNVCMNPASVLGLSFLSCPTPAASYSLSLSFDLTLSASLTDWSEPDLVELFHLAPHKLSPNRQQFLTCAVSALCRIQKLITLTL